MRTERRWLRLSGVSVILASVFIFSSRLLADPPARVARLNYIRGTASFRPATVDDWAPAQLNYPLTTGDGLWIDANSRAELHAGSTTIQLAPQTDVRFLNLDDRTAQVRLAQGTVETRIRSIRPGEIYEVDTPNVAISLVRPGWYRVDVDPQGNTTATVRDGGEAEMTASGTAFTLYDDQTAHIYGIDYPTYDIRSAPPPDGFDRWCLSRYRREERAASLRYVSREMIGYEDLDGYGYWQNISGYGPCWIPTRLVKGWAPYRYGRWCWNEPWGWTWIDEQPWGFITCHYGRWFHTADWGWAWMPGSLVARPYYAPALVAFIEGDNWGLSFVFGGGPIGWFPLGPSEIYLPPYRVSNIYLQSINYVVADFRLADINKSIRYVNWEVPEAVTVITRRAFVRSAPVHKAIVRVAKQKLESAKILGPVAPLAPRKESVLAHSAGLSFRRQAKPPAAAQNRPVAVRTTPPSPRIPFEAKEKLLKQNPGRPPLPTALENLRRQVRVSGPPVRRAIPEGPARGMRPVRAGIAPARPVAGAQVRGRPPGGEVRRQGPASAQRAAPGSRRGGGEARAVAPQRPPERLGRSQPPPSKAQRPQTGRRQAAPKPQKQIRTRPEPQQRQPQIQQRPQAKTRPPQEARGA